LIRLRNITGFVASGEPQCSTDDHLVRSWRRSCNQLVFAGPRLPFVQRPAHGRRHKASNGSARRRASRLLHRRGVWLRQRVPPSQIRFTPTRIG